MTPRPSIKTNVPPAAAPDAESLPSGAKTQYNVAAVQEALSLLMLVSAKPGLGVTELAKLTGNTKPRTYRLLATLENSGFVRRVSGQLSYQLGYATLTLGLAAQRQVDLAHIVQAHFQTLGARFNENLQLLLRDGLESVTIAIWDSTHELRIHHEVGRRRPLNAGASGKVLLAWAEPELLATALGDHLPRFTPQTLSDPAALRAQLEAIRAAGYAVSQSEVTADVVAIAAPVRDATGRVVASLSMSLPQSRAPRSLDELALAIRAEAMALSGELGWRSTA